MLLEPNIYALWVGKQTAKGTPNLAPSRRLQQVGGNFGVTRDDGSENFSDLSMYGDQEDWVNSLTGTGEPVLHATPVETAYLLWLAHGAETVTAVAAVPGPPAVPALSRHTFVPTPGIGFYASVYQRVGQSVIRRQQFNDALLTKFTLEASSANKAARITPRFLSLDPGITYGPTDPVATLPVEKPFLFTDFGANSGATTDGSATVDGVVYRGVTQFQLTVDNAWEPVYGDSATPYDFQQGSPSVTIGATIHADAAGMARWNKDVYGTATPAAGTKPLRSVPALGSFRGLMRQRDSAGLFNGLALDVTIPGVKWAIPDAPAPNPDGGSTEFALAGTMRPLPATSPYTIVLDLPTGTVAFTT